MGYFNHCTSFTDTSIHFIRELWANGMKYRYLVQKRTFHRSEMIFNFDLHVETLFKAFAHPYSKEARSINETRSASNLTILIPISLLCVKFKPDWTRREKDIRR